MMRLDPEYAYVITANDSVEAVVLGTEEEANRVRDRLEEDYDARQRKANGVGYDRRKPFIYWAARQTHVVSVS